MDALDILLDLSMNMSVQLRVLLMAYTYIWGWNQGCTLGCNWVTFEDAHGSALVSAKEFTKQFNKR